MTKHWRNDLRRVWDGTDLNTPHDDRAPLARAYDRATRGITVAIGMVAPGLGGYALDSRLGTRPLFTILGFGLGMAFGIWQLLQMARSPRDRDETAGK